MKEFPSKTTNQTTHPEQQVGTGPGFCQRDRALWEKLDGTFVIHHVDDILKKISRSVSKSSLKPTQDDFPSFMIFFSYWNLSSCITIWSLMVSADVHNLIDRRLAVRPAKEKKDGCGIWNFWSKTKKRSEIEKVSLFPKSTFHQKSRNLDT